MTCIDCGDADAVVLRMNDGERVQIEVCLECFELRLDRLEQKMENRPGLTRTDH